eukprot:TRINITY_DN29394_c0_g2_i1.p1 TRINITY_DN29394_c0_g2~~TRINITY_DN29394_c0_g2_i1.p1  ORF type:complete len:372 (-),score=47.84 TRINITY_DN29394_c0_g2_i1:219-1334(-)
MAPQDVKFSNNEKETYDAASGDESPIKLVRKKTRARTFSKAGSTDKDENAPLEEVALEEKWVNEEANELQKQLAEEGLSQMSFFLGVLNFVLIAFVLGRWPQHLWILYGLEAVVLIPAWYHHVIHYRMGHWFIVELCWVMNTIFTIYMLLTYLGLVPQTWRMTCFQMFYSHASYLSAFVVVGNQAVVFHSIERTASLFIHLVPCFVAAQIRFGSRLGHRMEDYWPGVFPTEEEMNEANILSNYLPGLAVYILWWAIYMVWFLSMGIDLPANGSPTVFGNIYERSKLGPIFVKKFGYKSLRAHGCIFMAFHFALCAFAIFCAASIGWHCFYFAVAWTALHFFCSLWSGAGYHLHVVVRHFEVGESAGQKKNK